MNENPNPNPNLHSPDTPNANHLAIELLGGTCAGIVGVLVGHPLDTIKVNLQSPHSLSPSPSITPIIPTTPLHPQLNTFNLTHSIWKAEGFPGFYRGVASPVLGAGFINAIIFVAHAHFQSLLFAPLQLPQQEQQPFHSAAILPLSQVAISGGLAGLLSSFAATPIDRIKTLQQAHPTPPFPISTSKTTTPITSHFTRFSVLNRTTSKCPLHCHDTPISTPPKAERPINHVIRWIYTTEGLRGFYRGLCATLIRDSSFAVYFGSYELTIRYFTRQSSRPTHGQVFFAGSLAGALAWTATYPFDVIKTQIQSYDSFAFANRFSDSKASHQPSAHHHQNGLRGPTGILSCFKRIIHTVGWSGFWKGFSPTIIRSVPVNAVTFWVHDLVVKSNWVALKQ